VPNVRTVFLSVAIISVLGFGFLSLSPPSYASAAVYNDVQISVQTSGILADYFSVSAFNMSGFQEALVQTHYSAASFELPSGQYIFTVTANNRIYSVYNPPVPLGAPSSGGQSSPSVPSLPLYVAPAVEYGYSLQQVSSSVAITITTEDVTRFPTNALTVEVLYANGTAAVGASVSASVVGSSYYWGYEPDVVTWASTGADGVATLVTPAAPVQVDAWIWLPSNATSYPSPQGGATGTAVNGTSVAVPVYLGLAGSALVVPPQATVSITLEAQQANYWVVPYVGVSTPSGSESGSVAGPGSVPYSVYGQQQGNPNLQNFQSPGSASPEPTVSPASSGGGVVGGGTLLLLVLVLVAVVVVVVVVSLVRASRIKRKKPLVSTSVSF
jgi:hypothetical protein